MFRLMTSDWCSRLLLIIACAVCINEFRFSLDKVMAHWDTGVADKCTNYCHTGRNIIPTCCYGDLV